MANVLASYKNDTNPGEALYAFGSPNFYNGATQPFTIAQLTPQLVSSIMMKLQKNGSPTEPNLISIAVDSGGAPGAYLGTATLAAASIPSSAAEVTVTSFDNPMILQPSTTYWLVWHAANQGSDFTNYYQWRISNTSIVYSAEYYKLNSTFIQETGYNCYFEIQGDTPPADVKTMDGVALANIKTVDGVA